MPNKSKEEIDLLILKLRDRLQDVLPSNKKFDNDFYLYRWLLQFHMDVDAAAKEIQESIVWRKENNVDELAEQDWGFGTGLENEFVATFDSTTKTGQPIMTINGENLDIRAIFRKYTKESFRKILIQMPAKLEKLMLDSYQKGLEVGLKNSSSENGVVKSSEGGISNLNSGYDPSWFSAAPVAILSYKNYSFSNLTHLEGIQMYLGMAKIGLTYFPAVVSSAYIMNLNKISGAVTKILKPILASDAFALEFYDTDKSKWTPKLMEIMDKDQLPVYFGGTYTESNATSSKNKLI